MIEFDPYSEAFLDDPHALYARLREESPIHHAEQFGATFLVPLRGHLGR